MPAPFQFIQVPNHVETTGNPPTVTTHWKATGSVDPNYVNAYGISATPAIITTIYGILYRQDLRVSQVAFNQFMVDVPYGQRKNETGEWTWDFDTTGGTVHIQNGRSETRFPATTAPDQKGAIGVNGDTVEGTDITIPTLNINVQYKHPLGVLTLAYAKYLRGLTGKVNSDSFLTFAPGEVLFLGARGSDGSVAEATVSYAFATSENATGLSFGQVSDVVKKGFETIWIKYQDEVATADSKDYTVRVPKFVYVTKVYDTAPLAASLGFGG